MKRMGPLSTHEDEDKFEVMKITLKNNRSTWNFIILYHLNFIFYFLWQTMNKDGRHIILAEILSKLSWN